MTDKPGGRKQHLGEIPLFGGIAMFIGILVAAMAAAQTTGQWTLLLPAALLVIVGVIDDRYNLGVSARLAAQICAALIMMIGGGLYLRDIGDPFGTGLLRLGILAIPGSVLVTLTVINARGSITVQATRAVLPRLAQLDPNWAPGPAEARPEAHEVQQNPSFANWSG